MSSLPATYYEPAVKHRCAECGDRFDLSGRASRDAARAGRSPICFSCRYPPIIVVTDALKGWWTNRYSTEEIVGLAEGMWGDRDGWAADPPQLRL